MNEKEIKNITLDDLHICSKKCDYRRENTCDYDGGLIGKNQFELCLPAIKIAIQAERKLTSGFSIAGCDWITFSTKCGQWDSRKCTVDKPDVRCFSYKPKET